MQSYPTEKKYQQVSLPEIRSVTLKQQVYDTLKAAILNSELDREKVYSVNQIAKTLSVSRTPVAMAIERLSQERLVTVLPNYGFQIVQFSRAQVTKIFELREAIEVHVVGCLANSKPDMTAVRANLENEAQALKDGLGLAAITADMDFHTALAEATANEWMVGALVKVKDLITLANWDLKNNAKRNQQVVAEHAAIVEAILAGDSMAAQEGMTSHLRHGAAILIQGIEKIEEDGSHQSTELTSL